MKTLTPDGWAPAVGYANGIETEGGRLVFIAGQIGWDADQQFHSDDLAAQFEQALANTIAVLDAAGGAPQHICRITAFCTDKPAYVAARRALGGIWKRHMGRHYPVMTMVFVSALLEDRAVIELEATAVVPN